MVFWDLHCVAHLLLNTVSEVLEWLLGILNSSLQFSEVTEIVGDASDESMKERDREFVEWVDARRTRLEEMERLALASLQDRLSAIDTAVEERREKHGEIAREIAEAGDSTAERLAEASERLAEIASTTTSSRYRRSRDA